MLVFTARSSATASQDTPGIRAQVCAGAGERPSRLDAVPLIAPWRRHMTTFVLAASQQVTEAATAVDDLIDLSNVRMKLRAPEEGSGLSNAALDAMERE
jgi:hypothetical protein